MKLHINRRIKTYIAKTFSAFAVFVLTFVVCFSGFNVFQVHADSEVAISAVTKQTEVGPGDLLMVEVVANNFPGITEFGPVVFNYDSDKAEFVSFEQGNDLSNYVFSEIRNDGSFTVTAQDQMMGIGTDENGNEILSSSFSSDNQVVLFTIAIRIFPESTGDINCWISETGEFISPTDTVSTRIGSGLTLPIKRSGLSSNATIASLKIRGTSITPDFNPNITEYSCSVERSVTDVQVTATPTNLWAAIVIDGAQQLNLGENIVTVNVTAQDGATHMCYTIHVVRKESNIPDNASLVDRDGNTYTFLDTPEDLSIPAGFTMTTRVINGYSVPVYVRDGVSSILLYLFDGEQTPGLYIYNSNSKTVSRYDPDNTIIETSKVLKITEVPNSVVIPEEFRPAVLTSGDTVITGFANADGDFICYLTDESGRADFYHIDRSDGSISLYRFADKRAELLYSYLFDVFLVIAIIEAVIITIIAYILRRMVSGRTNPRPKRV